MKEQSIFFSDEWEAAEKELLIKAQAIRNSNIDRSKTYEEQGIESHVNQKVADFLVREIKNLRKSKEEQFAPPKNWE